MVFLLRAAGWALFGAGALVFVLNGSFRNIRDPITMAALLAMPSGMILTLTANIIIWRRWIRGTRRKESTPTSLTPEVTTPARTYRTRPLDASRLKKPQADAGEGRSESKAE